MKKTIIIFLALFVTFSLRTVSAAAPTAVSDTLSNAQLSFFGSISSFDNTNTVTLNDNGWYSFKTSNLSVGGIIGIGRSFDGTWISDDLYNYTITNIGSTKSFSVSPFILEESITVNNFVVATQSAVHTVKFTPTVINTFGYTQVFQILIKTTDSNYGTNIFKDGLPNGNGFDMNRFFTDADVYCPSPYTASGVGDTITLIDNEAGGVNRGGDYLIINCESDGSQFLDNNPMTVTIGSTGYSGLEVSDHQLINPAPYEHIDYRSKSSLYSNNYINVFPFLIRHFYNGSLIPEDTVAGNIAATENVRVTANIDPVLTFQIDSVGTSTPGTIRCGSSISITDVLTSATKVPFGVLNLNEFYDLAQHLSCVTNAASGYVITAYENRPLSLISGGLNTGVTIPNTTCNAANACGVGSSNVWTETINSGFGYALEFGVTSPAIGSDATTIGIGATNIYRPFTVDPNSPQTIMSRAISTNTSPDNVYVCYRININALQPSGDYENSINYVATAYF
ncbi:MAG: hypothetical protein WCG91_03930 [Candidatus Shapirobacteria bacterium]